MANSNILVLCGVSAAIVGTLGASSCACAIPDRSGGDGHGEAGDVGIGQLSSTVVAGSRSAPRVVSDPGQRVLAHRVAGQAIAGDRLADGRFPIGAAGEDAARTDDGRELLTLLIGCALPADVTLVATGSGSPIEFAGGVGLAPRWLDRALDRAGRAWVTACVLSELSGTALGIPISIRGGRRALAASADEQAAWSLEEGAFFGDVFVDPDLPLPWFACRGVGSIDDVALADRVCTEADADHPGLTRCGMISAGSCPEACARRRHGAYRDCHAPAPWPTIETDRVVTAFLIP